MLKNVKEGGPTHIWHRFVVKMVALCQQLFVVYKSSNLEQDFDFNVIFTLYEKLIRFFTLHAVEPTACEYVLLRSKSVQCFSLCFPYCRKYIDYDYNL